MGDRPAMPAATTAPELDSAKRRQILDGARRVFFERGFEAASMDAITRAAGVSKATIYAYFPSKDDLIAALVTVEKREQAERFALPPDDERPVAEVLTELGTRTILAMARPEAVQRLRLVVGLAPKMPEIARAFFEDGPQFSTRRLGDYLARLVAEGRLTAADPYRAARQFLDLCLADTSRAIIFGMDPAVSPEAAAAHAAMATETFLRAYPVTGPAAPT
jgi:AcrR family transcriptional regulator